MFDLRIHGAVWLVLMATLAAIFFQGLTAARAVITS